MSVIGYIRNCRQCGIRMMLAPDARDQSMCTRCLDRSIADAIDAALANEPPEADDHIPPGQVRG